MLYNICGETYIFRDRPTRHCQKAKGIKWSNYKRLVVTCKIVVQDDCLERDVLSDRSGNLWIQLTVKKYFEDTRLG
jgi:hypothetical protein